MRKIVSVAVLTIFILTAVFGLVGCDNGSNEDEHDGPSMRDPIKDKWCVALDNVQNYCVDGFEPIMPSLGEYALVNTSIESGFYRNNVYNVSKYSYYTRMRNPLHRHTNDKIFDQVDVFILTDWIFDYPEKYGLTSEDYSDWEADLVTLEKADDGSSTQDMVIEYKVFYANVEHESRLSAYESKMLKSNFQYPCEITVDGISVMFDVVDFRDAPYGRELNFVYLNSGEKVVDEKSYTSYGCVQVEARWEYNNAVYFIRIPLLWQYWGEWLGSSSIEYVFRIIADADIDEIEQEELEEYEVYLKDYENGYYNIFEYDQARLEWFENKAPDYVKARFTAKKMLEYILPQYFFAK